MRRDHYSTTALSPMERKDDNGPDLSKQILAFGGDVKALKESIQRDLETIRTDVKGLAHASDVDEKINRATNEILAKHDTLELLLKTETERADLLETALKRAPTGDQKSETETIENAIAFMEAKSAVSGSLNWRSRPTAETAGVDDYALWQKHFGDYLRVDDRGMNSPDQAKALSVGSNPNGGYLVPTARSARITGRIIESSPMRRLATVITIGTDTFEIPVDQGEAEAGWVGEEEARPITGTPQFGNQVIQVHEISAKPQVTQKFLEDAAIDVERWLENKVADKFARVEARSFIVGNGIKKPRGILSYPEAPVNVLNSDTPRGFIRTVPSGNATALTADALVGLPFALKDFYSGRASWLMKRSSILAVMLLKDGDGQYLWAPGLTQKGSMTLRGYNAEMADDMPGVAAGSLSVAFGDWSSAYTVVDRLGITTLRDPYSNKPFVQFYTRKRVGGDVTDFEAYAVMKTAAA